MKKWEIYKIFNSQDKIIAGTTTKNLKKPYSYSLAVHTGEELEKIKINREDFENSFSKKFKIVTLSQIHSSKIIDADRLENFSSWLNKKIEADGVVTSQKNIMLTILTADCMALLAYDDKNKIIGAAHAGWRGTKDNIVKNMIDFMVKKGAKIENIKVALSPCIKSCCYEVGEDVAKHFFEFEDAIVKTGEKKWHLDISIVNKLKLLDFGIKEENIELNNTCTSCNSQDYFSYRKECGCSGRFISYIAMEE